MKIRGWVNNSNQGVNIHAEGEEIEEFYARLRAEIPPLAHILSSNWHEVALVGYEDFRIVTSEEAQGAKVLVSPDVAICSDCLADIRDPENRRFRYPFANCTNCGPRYTIIRDVPYDRPNTTMAAFPLCAECAAEYADPLDRRFHAQPVACGGCGPQVELLDSAGQILPGWGIDQLAAGNILAIKGLGGFHLVCDAGNPEAVNRLRARKERGAKPFAIMARNRGAALREVELSRVEVELLESPGAPIVIAERRSGESSRLASAIAPGMDTLGVMLPYTPLHHILFEGPYDFLVMTSANLSGEPLIYENSEALAGLRGIADYFLLHNRDIFHPCDDSVVRVIGGEVVYIRRARGYVPRPVEVSTPILRPMLAVGGELKNAFCLASRELAFMSQYLGDMEDYASFLRFQQELQSFQHVASIVPQAVAHDLHPNYQTTRFALDSSWPKVSVQHHHAHLVSVLGEHGAEQRVLGVICDGTGYGEDGRIWGFEFLYGNARGFERWAHLEYLPLPGGDAGAKKPLRIAYAYLKTLFSASEWASCEQLFGRASTKLPEDEMRWLDWQLQSGVQVFPTSSTGRLFDAVSALLGICTRVTYEGQAAMELEAAATIWARGQGIEAGQSQFNPVGLKQKYPVEIRPEQDGLSLGVHALFREMVDDILAGVEPGEIAYWFHRAVAEAIVETIVRLEYTGPVVLNGGVFQNKLLTERVMRLCQNQDIQVLRARRLPPGDGGLAYGQILIANEVLNKCV